MSDKIGQIIDDELRFRLTGVRQAGSIAASAATYSRDNKAVADQHKGSAQKYIDTARLFEDVAIRRANLEVARMYKFMR